VGGEYSMLGINEKYIKNLVGKSERKSPLEESDLDVQLILEFNLGKQDRNVWTGCIWFTVGTSGGLL
jgi:hypothetical protein